MVMLQYELKGKKGLHFLYFLFFCQQEIFASKDLAEKVSLADTQSTCGFMILQYWISNDTCCIKWSPQRKRFPGSKSEAGMFWICTLAFLGVDFKENEG